MSNPLERRDLIKALLLLTGRSASSLAVEVGLNRSNVTHWLKHGGTAVGVERQDELLERLGVAGGTLNSNLVHVWTIKSGDLYPLSSLLSFADSHPFEMVYLFPSSMKFKNYFEFFKKPLLIQSTFSSFPIRIVFRNLPPILLPETKSQKLDDVLVRTGVAKWRNIPKKYLYPGIDVDNSIYEKFFSGKDLSIQEFEQVWNSGESDWEGRKMKETAISSWEEFISWAEQQGIRPEDARRYISENQGK